MPTYTPHLGLVLPELTEDADIEQINSNMESLDTKIMNIDDALASPVIPENGSVSEVKLADDSVSTRTLQDGSVTSPILANRSVSLGFGTGVAGKLDAEYVSFTSGGVANSEEPVSHTLGRVPSGYLVVRKSKAGNLYDGETLWNPTTIFLKSDQPNTSYTILIW